MRIHHKGNNMNPFTREEQEAAAQRIHDNKSKWDYTTEEPSLSAKLHLTASMMDSIIKDPVGSLPVLLGMLRGRQGTQIQDALREAADLLAGTGEVQN